MFRYLIKLSISLMILSFILWHLGLQNIISRMWRMKLSALFFINITTLFGFFCGGAGVILLGKTINPKLPWRNGMKGFLSTTSLSLFAPGRTGDIALPFFWRAFLRYGECMAVIVTDKLITLLAVLTFGSLGLGMIFNISTGITAFFSLFLSVSILLIVIALPAARKWIAKKLPDPIKLFLEGFVTTVKHLLFRGQKTLIGLLFLTVSRVIIYGAGFWISLWGIGIKAPFFYSVFVLSIAQLVGFLPITIMGLGSVEAVCIYAFARIGMESSSIVAALFIGRGINILWLSIFFLLFNVGRLPVGSRKS
ncbi:MAG: flippase-like domain-containing protein [Deltaproteobacteria bacterium]|nr:flippase-like domain-containing protein [Deltaproteobacteria bacterium]